MENSAEASSKAGRRVWSREEEEALLNVLDEFVAAGLQADCGAFVSGTRKQIERRMAEMIPGTDLRFIPHIDSKMKDWKRKYGVFYDMLNTSGFGWNEEKKWIEVDSDEAWNNYVQYHKAAKGWRRKPFPIYERLAHIWGKDRATGRGARVPSDMPYDVEENEPEFMSNLQDQFMENSPMSTNHPTQTVGDSQLSGRKRKRSKDGDVGKIVDAIDRIVESSNNAFKEMVEKMTGDPTAFNQPIIRDLTRLGFSFEEKIKVASMLAKHPDMMVVYKMLEDDQDKLGYILQLLRD